MNTFTKILIVAVALINVAVSVLFISMVNTSGNYKEMYLTSKDENAALVQQATADRSEAQRAKAQLVELQSQAQQANSAVSLELTRAQQTIIAQNSEIARQKNLLESLNVKLTGLEGSVNQQVSMIEDQAGQLKDRILENQDLNDQVREATLARQELARNLESARQHAQLQHAQLLAAQDKIRELEDRISSGGYATTEDTPAPVSAVEINAEIIDVDSGSLAMINVGSASGVQEGMVFLISRGSQYIGDLTIQNVTSDNSAGILSSLQSTPQVGDTAFTK